MSATIHSKSRILSNDDLLGNLDSYLLTLPGYDASKCLPGLSSYEQHGFTMANICLVINELIEISGLSSAGETDSAFPKDMAEYLKRDAHIRTSLVDQEQDDGNSPSL